MGRWLAKQGGRVVARRPADKPELNPVEYRFGHLQQHELPNSCPADYPPLSRNVRRALRRSQRRPSLLSVFWNQACFLVVSTIF